MVKKENIFEVGELKNKDVSSENIVVFGNCFHGKSFFLNALKDVMEEDFDEFNESSNMFKEGTNKFIFRETKEGKILCDTQGLDGKTFQDGGELNSNYNIFWEKMTGRKVAIFATFDLERRARYGTFVKRLKAELGFLKHGGMEAIKRPIEINLFFNRYSKRKDRQAIEIINYFVENNYKIGLIILGEQKRAKETKRKLYRINSITSPSKSQKKKVKLKIQQFKVASRPPFWQPHLITNDNLVDFLLPINKQEIDHDLMTKKKYLKLGTATCKFINSLALREKQAYGSRIRAINEKLGKNLYWYNFAERDSDFETYFNERNIKQLKIVNEINRVLSMHSEMNDDDDEME
mmetsp:Transcript_7426/g.10973  ORF Transcript_7426/g.10973 Transcript_7426/m.10973 type:complete len:349 (-) Transcript_7426:118-1164(-)